MKKHVENSHIYSCKKNNLPESISVSSKIGLFIECTLFAFAPSKQGQA